MNEVQLVLQGLSCDHCIRSLERALGQVPGTHQVEVSLERARVQGSAPVEHLLAAVREEGYEARLA